MTYLDHNATTNIYQEVAKIMYDLASTGLYNPSAIHSYGRKGKSLIESSRKEIAQLLNIPNDNFKEYQITFTASGTEANNLILSNFKNGEIFISAIEHPSIFNHSKISNNVTIIQVDKDGLLDLKDLKNKLENSRSEKKLLSVMLANNNNGVIQPIKEIVKIAREYGVLVHSDFVQAAGKININIIDLDVDFASISAHKFGGPMGVGALIGKTKIHLEPIIIGGGQERGLRSGTENVPAIVGFGKAAKITKKELENNISHMKKLQKKLEEALLQRGDIKIVSHNKLRLPNTSMLINKNKKSETQLIALDMRSIAISSGSACSSGKTVVPYDLLAMGYSKEESESALRISIGRNTSKEDIEKFITTYNEINAL